LNKKAFLALGLASCICASFSAQTDQDRFAAEKNSKSHEISFEKRDLTLLPQSEFSEEIKSYVFGAWTDKCGHAYEKVYTISKAQLGEDFSIQDASVLLRSISKMEGMLYYSRSDKDWGVLYSQAHTVESAKSDKAVPDLAVGSADKKTIFAFMDDHTFGKSKYKITYRQTQNQLTMFMENVSPLCYGPLKAVQPKGFKLCATVIDSGDSFVVYMSDCVEFKIISALRQRLNNSFEARLEAICLWFIKMGA